MNTEETLSSIVRHLFSSNAFEMSVLFHFAHQSPFARRQSGLGSQLRKQGRGLLLEQPVLPGLERLPLRDLRPGEECETGPTAAERAVNGLYRGKRANFKRLVLGCFEAVFYV